ncbi:PAS domain-containing protein [Actinokineospora guangxiensis]|uniref:PAS domain-containing protein n=1 Tax=Actinokineospora guangxiensis TaxID=1490288 RepID=A0ABW0EVV9_9PSEU
MPPEDLPITDFERLALDGVQAGFWVVDNDLRFTVALGGIFNWPGTTRPAPGSPLASFLGPEPEEMAEPGRLTSWRAHRQALAGATVQWRVDLPTGPYLYSLWALGQEGAVTGVCGALIPLTPGYAGDMADADSVAWLAQVMHHLPATVAVRDRLSRTVWASPRYLAAAGHDLSSIVGLTEADVHSGGEATDGPAADRLVLATDQAVLTRRSWIDRDGSPRDSDEIRFPLTGPGGEPLVGHLALDVSEREAERRRAEEAERRFTAFMDHAPFGAWIKDHERRYLWANRAHLRTLGDIGLNTLIGRSAAEASAPWREDACDARTDVALRGGESTAISAEFEVDGERRCQQGFVFPITPGVADGLIGGVFADVTELDAARRAAELANERFEAFMRHVPAAAYVKDPDGRHVWANRAYLTHYGLESLEDLVGKTTDDLDGPALAKTNSYEDGRTLTGGLPRLISTNGEDGAAVAIGYRFTVPFDGETRLAGIWVDTSELARARTTLKRWRDRHATLFGHTPTPVLVSTSAGEVVDANPAFCALVGRRLAELRSLSGDDLTGAPGWRPVLADLVAGRVSTARYDRSFVLPDGATVEAAVTAVRVLDPHDGTDRIVEMLSTATPPAAPEATTVLNDTEASVLAMRAAGSSVAEIASALSMSRRGVDYHLKVLARRLRCPTNNAAALISRAYHLGVLDTGAWPPQVPAHHRCAK